MDNCKDIVNMKTLLEPMNLKDIWRYEEKDFSPWVKEYIEDIGNIIQMRLGLADNIKTKE